MVSKAYDFDDDNNEGIVGMIAVMIMIIMMMMITMMICIMMMIRIRYTSGMGQIRMKQQQIL